KDSSRFSWELVTKLEERPLGFLLFPQPQIAFWLPKHGFENDAEIERFRALAESKSIPFRRRT
ncbi:MAG: YcxB family protein, partial [Synechococcus sp.]|nr:YcxB family protein [Synechococcus sp.]